MNLSTDQITLIAVFVSASIALITAIITAFVALRTNAQSRKNEHKLSVLKVLLEAAYKEYEFRARVELEIAKNENREPKIFSFTEYVIFYRQMADVFSEVEVEPKDIIETLKKNKILIDTYYSNRENQEPEYHKSND